MLQNIRDNSQGWIAKTIIGVIVVLMALTGFDAIIQSTSNSQNAADVNGEKITQSSLNAAVDMQRRQLIQQFGKDFDASLLDDKLLRRAGLIDDATYLKLITKTINQVLQTPGRQVQTVAQASFDAWVKYYRQDENTPNATVSYYTKGSLVALCLDLHLRQHGKATLDDVMRGLWSRCKAGPMSEADLLTVLEELTGRGYAAEIAQWVHSTDELPLAALLAAHGVTLKPDTAQLAQRLGIRVAENHSVQIKTVLRGSAAEQAGFAAGDEWLGLRVKTQAWRINKLDDVAFYAGPQTQLVAVVARDGRLLELPLTLPAAVPPGSVAQGKSRRQPAPDTVNLTATDDVAVMSAGQLDAFFAASPIVLDLDGNGISTIAASSGVSFDLNASGTKQQVGWVGGGDGLLVMDRNGDGLINDGSELFGVATVGANGQRAGNGYAAMGFEDSNHDGVLDAKDAHWNELKVWVDANHDGVTETGELKTLAEVGVASIDLHAQTTSEVNNGNYVGLVSSYTTTDGSTHQVADVWFSKNTSATTAHRPSHCHARSPTSSTQSGFCTLILFINEPKLVLPSG